MDGWFIEQQNKQVAKVLREKYRISWRKAVAVCGYDYFTRFHEAGNMINRTAYCASILVKQEKSNAAN